MISNEAWNTFMQTIPVMIKGMSGIFIFMGVFFFIVKGLDKLFPKEIEKGNGAD